MKFILTPFFNAFFQFWNQLHRQISSVITRVFPTEATHVYRAKKMLKMIPIVRFLRLCPKKIQCPLLYLFEKNLMNYYYSYFTDFLMTCVLEAEITRFVYPRLGTNSKIRRITAIIRRDYLPNHYSRRSEYWVITRRIFANYWRPKLLASPRQQVPVLSTALRIAWCSFSPQTGRKEGRISGKNYIVATNIVTTFPMAEKLQQKRKNRVSKA